jgi:hypothetical protein
LNGWGNNPATVEAAATALAVVAVLVGWLSVRESRRQRRAFEAEMGARMRPWVGLFALEFQRIDGKANLHVLLRNFGPVPAQRARLRMVIEPREPRSEERPNPIRYEEENEKALMPTENGDYNIDLSCYPQLETWVSDKRDVAVHGSFEYHLDRRDFSSQFVARLRFGEGSLPGGGVRTSWRNSAAE